MRADRGRRRAAVRRPVAAVAAAAALLAGAASFVAPAGASAPPTTAPTGPYELAPATVGALRTAAEGIGTVGDALATGRADLGICADGSGYYFANSDKIADGLLDPVDPEALVYADIDGARRLVAVAWLSLAPAQVEGVPLHLDDDLGAWVLHAWVGVDNPAGILADRNPLVGACDVPEPTDVVPPDSTGPAGLRASAATTSGSANGAGPASASPPGTSGELPTGVFELPSDTIDALRVAFADAGDPAFAAAGGWSPTGRCIERTGWIVADRTAIFDGALDPARPELLVYADVDTARLVAVGWAASAPARLLGVPLHPEGDVWVLYAWIGLDNPAGLLADHHPAIAPCAVGLADVDGIDEPPASSDPTTATTVPSEPTTTSATTTTSPDGSTTTAPDTTAPDTTDAPTTTTAPGGFPFNVSSTTIDFGTVPVGITTGTFINVTNTDSVPHQIAIAIEPTGVRFPAASNCTGVVDPGESCRVSYSFAPTRALATFSTTTSFRLACCGDGRTMDVTITLRGAAIDPGPTGSQPGSIDPPAEGPGIEPPTSGGG